MVETSVPGPLVAPLGSVTWMEEAPGIHSRSTVLNGTRRAVVRYAPSAERDDWCTDGHHGYVLHGHISYELEGGERLDVPAGAAFWLPPDSGHRGVNGDEETQLFLIDVPDADAQASG